MRRFTIDAEDEAEIAKFREIVKAARLASGKDMCVGAIGGEESFTFTPTGVGVIVEYSYFGQKLDLSHMEDW